MNSLRRHPGTFIHVYRVLGEHDRVLYIGISGDLVGRFRWHLYNSPWWDEMRRVTTESFETSEDAGAAEQAAIRSQRPVYNRATAPLDRNGRAINAAASRCGGVPPPRTR